MRGRLPRVQVITTGHPVTILLDSISTTQLVSLLAGAALGGLLGWTYPRVVTVLAGISIGGGIGLGIAKLIEVRQLTP